MTDSGKTGVYISDRAGANACRLFFCKPSRVRHDGYAAVGLVVCVKCDGVSRFALVMFSSNAHGPRCASGNLASFDSPLAEQYQRRVAQVDCLQGKHLRTFFESFELLRRVYALYRYTSTTYQV